MVVLLFDALGCCPGFITFLAVNTLLPSPMNWGLLHSHIDTIFGIQ